MVFGMRVPNITGTIYNVPLCKHTTQSQDILIVMPAPEGPPPPDPINVLILCPEKDIATLVGSGPGPRATLETKIK